MNRSLAVLVVFACAACGSKELLVTMNPDNNSGQAGFAVVTQEKGGLRVYVETSVPDVETPQMAHIHEGNCGEIGAMLVPLVSLTRASDRARFTSTSTNLDKTVAGDPFGFTQLADPARTFAINVHDSRDPQVYVSCGELPRP